MKSIIRHTKRVIVTVVGVTIVLAGLAMLVLPGPGWIAIIAGLALLATEYVWAKRLLESARRQAANGARAMSAGFRKTAGRGAREKARPMALVEPSGANTKPGRRALVAREPQGVDAATDPEPTLNG